MCFNFDYLILVPLSTVYDSYKITKFEIYLF